MPPSCRPARSSRIGSERESFIATMIPYQQARQKVIEVAGELVRQPGREPRSEEIEVNAALGEVLAERIVADRDYPPFDRSTRDGFAVRAADAVAPDAALERVGEIKAGDTFTGKVSPGQCVEIMTGAAVPLGADAVVMVEHTRREGNRVVINRAVERGQNVVPRGSEAKAGQAMLEPGTRLGYAELALAAQVGKHRVFTFRRPRLAILSTGDEVVAIDETPGPFQIRNSNSVSLAAQATLAGAEAVRLGNAPDRAAELRALIERGLESDILVLSGGVSMGKYDLVEAVLRELGAEFYFDAVAIRPGRPAVFGTCRGKCVFGLPGNPVSTMVTFELFVVPAIDLLSGTAPRPLPFFRARLAAAVKHKPGLTHFVPAQLTWPQAAAGADVPTVRELSWQGSGDIVALASANCFLVVGPEKLEYAAGDWAEVLPRRGLL
jgi:molybdopterin molybdotransferase